MPEPRGADWSNEEVSATVSSYFGMLEKELQGVRFNKAAENEDLRSRLNGRSRGSVEFKHQNISAVLLENGWLYIQGYKPMKNVQARLRDEVENRLRLDKDLDIAMDVASSFVNFAPIVNLGTPTDPPDVTLGVASWSPRKTGIKRDYVFRDARNAALGCAGEVAVVAHERARLTAAGRVDLAARVEHVAETQGDGLGYDVLSFAATGAERFIEVKTTLYSIETPFFISSGEVEASEFYADQYRLQRLYQFATRPGHYVLRGPVHESCQLVPLNFSGLPVR